MQDIHSADEQAEGERPGQADTRPSRRAVLILFAVALVLPAACSSNSGGNSNGSRDNGTEAPSTEPKWSADQRTVLAAYDAFLAAVDKAMTEPLNPSEPAVAQHATPEVAASVGLDVVGLQAMGQAIRPNTTFIAESVVIADNSAQLEGCTIDRDVRYEVATGSVVNDRVGRFATTSTLVLGADGAWRVSQEARQDNGTCENG